MISCNFDGMFWDQYGQQYDSGCQKGGLPSKLVVLIGTVKF